MIKNITALVFLIFLTNCLSISSKKENNFSENYYIKSIDSINNYYIIRTSKNDTIFNIISKKNLNNKCSNKVVKHRTYQLNLHSIFKDIQPIIVKNNFSHITSWSIDDSLSIKIDSISNYYTTGDIEDLCIK